MKKIAKPLITVLLVAALLVPTVAMIVTNAADGDTVELAFNNIFVFEKWANNSLSSTVVADGVPNTGGTLETDIENGSFRLTKTDMAANEVYTAFSMSEENAAMNSNYYTMPVEPNTTYTFAYNVTGNIHIFNILVFMFTDEGLSTGPDTIISYGTPGYGANSFKFTTLSNVTGIQIRFTIGDDNVLQQGNHTQSSVYADVSDIIIYKNELEDIYLESLKSKNLFSFQGWAGNSYSSSPIDSNTGTITTDTNSETITFTTAATAGTTLWSGNGVLTTTPSTYYYSVDVEPNTSYTLTYSISDSTLPGPVHCQPYIIEYDANGVQTALFNYETPALIGNKKVFTTAATTDKLQLVFAVINNGEATSRTCKVYDIGIYNSEYLNYDFSDITGHVHRESYTYAGDNSTYGSLPVPSTIPEGKVFAGWYTGEDGTGKLISSDTKISYESYTVYPKYETKLDEGGLKIDTLPTKLTYTLGEKINTAGLVLEATVTTDGGTNVYKINSGYRYSPETVATTPGIQAITVTYGGQSVTYDVTVVDSLTESVKVNGVATDVAVTNNEYFINLTGTDFNRYEITYYSDAYVKAVLNTTATDGTTVSEEFFLEPSTNGSFASFIDGFLDADIYTNISSISFEPLNKDFFTFELYSVETIFANRPTDNMQYQQDNTHKVGIDLSMGGAIAYIEELSGDVVASYYGEGQAAQVDYKSMITGGTQISEGVNLINRHDPGRFVQQSYYGTREDPYVTGDYNGVEWNYNPVQGGNYMFESSKIVDYRITSNEIYVKTRPLDWGKYSDEFANSKEGDWTDNDGDGVLDEGELVLDPRYGDEYITDSYMEAWYVFEDDMVKTYCRFVDYSGYPANTTTQELPAFYPVEPLNTFAYYDGETIWEEEPKFDFANACKENEPDFWGVSPNYNTMLTTNGLSAVNPIAFNEENWAAFMGSDNENSFGIGIYSAGVTEFHYGTYPQIREEPKVDDNKVLDTTLTSTQFNNADMYENGVVTMPDLQDATSYIAPVGTMTFESYKPYNYSYYIASGTLHDIREDFRRAKADDDEAAVAGADIAVPETAYMTPSGSDANSTIGLYYVNNIIDANNNYSVETVSERADTMSFGVHINGATKFTVDVVNATSPSDDIDLYDASGKEVANTHEFDLGEHTGYAVIDENYTLRFNTTGLAPNGKATAKWIFTGYDASGNIVGTYTAYTVMYAPGLTIGAVAEGRITSGSNNEISSWITGSNGVDHKQRAPLGSFYGDYHDSGRFIYDPLVYTTVQTPSGAGSQSEDDYIITTDTNGTTDDYGDNAYVLQTATNGDNSSRSQSYLGLLKIDKSRYTNTNQIPNLEIGFDALRISSDKNNSLQNYDTYYVLGTTESYTATSISEAPSGWTHFSSYTDTNSKKAVPFRETVIPDYEVTDDIEGKYIHALNQGMATYSLAGNSYSTAGSSVLISLTDKSNLRDSVMEGYTLPEEKYSESSYNKFLEKLEDAAFILGDPSASQESIDQAQKELDDVINELVNIYYSLKYDNLFSAYEYSQKPGGMVANDTNAVVSYSKDTAGITITNNNTSKTDISVSNGYGDNYYNIAVTPSTEYVFEYDLETVGGSQMHLFFYDVAEGNTYGSADWLLPSGRSVEFTNSNGVTTTSTIADGSNKFMWYYSANSGHVVMKFTTPANADVVVFRFGNDKTTTSVSTFSNIRLIEASKYYADVDYTKTEDVYLEHASYGTLPTLTRAGYTFGGWIDENGNAVTGADIATENKSIYSKWAPTDYTIRYDANGGSVSPASKVYDIEDTLVLPNPTNGGYTFAGWKVTTADGNWTSGTVYQANENLSGMYGNVTLTAQWTVGSFNAYFDTILDFSEWNTETASNATITNVTDNGFTLTSTATMIKDGKEVATGEGTSSSPYFAVEPGKSYKVDIDITGDNWDVYFFFCDNNGNWIDFNDGTNRYASNGHGPADRVFTAPNKSEVVKAQIRVDANGASNTVTFSDIRVYEAGTCAPNVDVPFSSKDVTFNKAFGDLPTPTREGYTFQGWYDGNTLITKDTIVTQTSDVYLISKWVINDSALVSDTVVIDFAKPIDIKPLANDTVYASAEGTKTFLGISSDGTSTLATSVTGTYGTFTVNGDTVTYKPTEIVNGTEKIYYHASVTADGVTTNIKNEIIVVPASNVLYEEDKFTVANAGGEEWKATATAGTGKQDASGENDIYGYDSSYNKIENYSNGSAIAVTVDSENKRSQNIAFTFEGTGFDLNSACGPNTGVMIVSLRDNNYVNDKNETQPKIIKSYIVDTYYGDYDDENVSRYGDTLYQVPIISDTERDYSNYTIQIVASWLPSMSGALNTNSVSTQTLDNGMTANIAEYANSEELREALADIGMEYVLDAEEVSVVWFDEDSVLNGGEGAETVEDGMLETQSVTELVNVVDSVRVYNPITDGDQYYIPSEQGVVYYNVIDNLTTKDSWLSGEKLFAYIMGTDKQDITVENYSQIGPKDELYLTSGTGAITFTIKNLDKNKSKVMISLKAASGKDVVVGFGNENTRTITSNTEMYYDITDYVNDSDGTVVIENKTAGTLLSVGSVKLSGMVQPAMLSMFNLDTALAMMSAPKTEPDVTEPETTVPDVTEPETTVPDVTEPETTVPDVTEPETTVPDVTEPETTVPDVTEPETTVPDVTEPEDTTDPDDSEDITDPDGSDEPADPDDSTECWLVRLIKWIVSMFKKIFSAINSILGF